MNYKNCTLCPRACGADRTNGQTGFCGCSDQALVAKAMLHKWEEPALAGAGGYAFAGPCADLQRRGQSRRRYHGADFFGSDGGILCAADNFLLPKDEIKQR